MPTPLVVGLGKIGVFMIFLGVFLVCLGKTGYHWVKPNDTLELSYQNHWFMSPSAFQDHGCNGSKKNKKRILSANATTPFSEGRLFPRVLNSGF